MAIRQETLAAVRKVLSNYPETMLTTEQVAHKAMISYNTAKRALVESGARFTLTWPKRWTLKDVPGTVLPPQMEKIATTGLPRVGTPAKLNSKDVICTTEPELIQNWNAARANVAQSIAELDIQPTKDIGELLSMFNRLATIGASLALALSEASTSPDWYGQIFNEDIDPELAP